MAAVQAAKMGKTVALIEPSQHLGGMSVEGLGGSDINNHGEFKNDAVVGGLALKFYRQVAAHYGIADFEAARAEAMTWRFEPHVAEAIFNQWVEGDSAIRVFRGFRLFEEGASVGKQGRRVKELRTAEGMIFRAGVFIDATYEGDLLAAAGISTIVGREANATYGETKNGIRGENTYRQFEVTVDPYRIPGDPGSGLIPSVQGEPLGTPGAADHRIQAYCFRMCLTQDTANQIPFMPPPGYDRGQYEIYLRYLKAGGQLYQPRVSIPNGKTDLGAWHDLSHNLYGMNHGYPEGTAAQRDSILQYHRHFTQGLFYFLAHDPEVGMLDPALQDAWSYWGLAADEFLDNGGWPRMFYIREARRMVSEYVITEHHTRRENPTPVADPIAVAYWPPDTHHARRIVQQGQAYNEGFVFGGEDWAPFGISYQALVPKPEECTNLLTPTCLSSTHVAYGAIRLEWTFMILGQSAGTAAVLALEGDIPVQDISYPELQQQLQADEQILEVRY